jgi:hypothetical protein
MAKDYGLADFNEEEMAQDSSSNQKSNRVMDAYVKMPEGKGFLLIRLLPALKGKPNFVATRLHRLGTASYHCSRVKTNTPKGVMWINATGNPKDDCPICQEYGRLWKVSNNQSGEEQARTQNEARLLKPNERYYWNCIVRNYTRNNVTEKNAGPLIYSCGKVVQTIIADNIAGNETTGIRRLGNILNPATGRDFRLVKNIAKGNGGFEYPNYAQSVFEDVSVLGTEEEIDKWLANLHDLEALRDIRPREQLIEALREFKTGGSEGVPAWEQPSAPAKQNAPAAAKAPAQPKVDIENMGIDMDADLSNVLDNLN